MLHGSPPPEPAKARRDRIIMELYPLHTARIHALGTCLEWVRHMPENPLTLEIAGKLVGQINSLLSEPVPVAPREV